MNLVERYIFRIAAGAFVACVVVLTAVIWLTQALRQLDVVTAQGQTILVFLTVTGLTIPTLIAVIAPVALFIAALYALNRLNSDSELIVMSAAGMSPVRLLRPFLALGGMVAGLVAILMIVLIPSSFQEIRDLITRIRADFLANIAQEGQFTTLENGVTFHYRERAGGALLGIFLQDRREQGRTTVYIAERGQAVEHNGGSYLVLQNGSIHRQRPNAVDSSIVTFERYAIDLSALNQEAAELVYKPRERSTGDLLMPDRNEPLYKAQPGRFRAELHDRLSAWLFPLASVFIAFAALGDPRTTRQGRGAAIAGAIVAVVALRIGIFAGTSAAARSAGALWLVYGLPIGAILLSAALIIGGPRLRASVGRFTAGARLRIAGLAPSRLRLRRA
jgi:lipopolysaccharide export system permease protein